MKKIIMPVALTFLISLSIFVIADFDEAQEYKYQEITLKEGWNLVTIYAIRNAVDVDQSDWDREQMQKQNIRAIFFYDFNNGEYIRTYPDIQRDKLQTFISQIDPEEGGSIDDYWRLTNSAMWVYSDKRQSITFGTTDGPAPLSYLKLKSGWNFLTITPEMKGKSLNELKGDCNMDKVYHFETSIQEWSPNLANDNFMDEKLTQDSLWLGLVIRVTNDCRLGGSSITPPSIPN